MGEGEASAGASTRKSCHHYRTVRGAVVAVPCPVPPKPSQSPSPESTHPPADPPMPRPLLQSRKNLSECAETSLQLAQLMMSVLTRVLSGCTGSTGPFCEPSVGHDQLPRIFTPDFTGGLLVLAGLTGLTGPAAGVQHTAASALGPKRR